MDPIYLSILLYFASIALVLVDLYVPSAGTLLVLALFAAIGCVVFGFQKGTTAGMTMLTLVAGSIPVMGIIAIRIWPHTPIGRRIVLGLPPAQPKPEGGQNDELNKLLGTVVVSEYPLMPSGQITIDRHSYNATAEAAYVEAGARVEVVAVRRRELVVRNTDKPLTPVRPRQVSEGAQGVEQATFATNGNLLDVPANELGLDSLDS